MIDLTDSICALSTAPGRSGIGLVRLSGPDSFQILAGVFHAAHAPAKASPRKAVLGHVFDPQTHEELDEALVTCFPTPRSYTGEDVAEISVHGSPVVIAHLLEYLCRQGARLAEPGEFTMRAFLHGRMNLSEAEAVRDVIEAQTMYQLQVASRQRSGELSRQLEPVKRSLTDVIVSLETAVEFVEEDLALDGRETLAAKLEQILEEVGRWVAPSGTGGLCAMASAWPWWAVRMSGRAACLTRFWPRSARL